MTDEDYIEIGRAYVEYELAYKRRFDASWNRVPLHEREEAAISEVRAKHRLDALYKTRSER